MAKNTKKKTNFAVLEVDGACNSKSKKLCCTIFDCTKS